MDINELNLCEETTEHDNWPVPSACQKRSFAEIFFKEGGGEWLDFLMDDAYLESARIVLRNIIATDYDPFYGPVVLYLIRHYLEIKLKLVCFHARWLRQGGDNADHDEIEQIAKNHKLGKLFLEMRREIVARIRQEMLDEVDVAYVQRFVEELDKLDPDGERFRYSVEQIKIHSSPVRRFRLKIDWSELLKAIEHCEQVLDYIDAFFVNQHGLNRDAEADMSS